jgi:hypothetical protein
MPSPDNAQEGAMELQYEWTIDDLKTYAKRPRQDAGSGPGPGDWRTGYALLGAAVVAAAVVTVATLMIRDVTTLVCVNVLIIAVLPVAAARAIVWSARRGMDEVVEREFEGCPRSTPVTLTLGPSGISQQTPAASRTIVWSAVGYSQDWPEQITLRCGIVGVLIIPKRAFQSEQHMRAFLDEVNAHRSHALLAGVPPVR